MSVTWADESGTPTGVKRRNRYRLGPRLGRWRFLAFRRLLTTWLYLGQGRERHESARPLVAGHVRMLARLMVWRLMMSSYARVSAGSRAMASDLDGCGLDRWRRLSISMAYDALCSNSAVFTSSSARWISCFPSFSLAELIHTIGPRHHRTSRAVHKRLPRLFRGAIIGA